jgi:Flp pilus assembly pilin Flp
MEQTLHQCVKWSSRNNGLRQFFLDESGQDIIEYALLCAFIGAVGMLAWSGVRSSLGTLYTDWGTGVQNLSACTPDPGGGGCP